MKGGAIETQKDLFEMKSQVFRAGKKYINAHKYKPKILMLSQFGRALSTGPKSPPFSGSGRAWPIKKVGQLLPARPKPVRAVVILLLFSFFLFIYLLNSYKFNMS